MQIYMYTFYLFETIVSMDLLSLFKLIQILFFDLMMTKTIIY